MTPVYTLSWTLLVNRAIISLGTQTVVASSAPRHCQGLRYLKFIGASANPTNEDTSSLISWTTLGYSQHTSGHI